MAVAGYADAKKVPRAPESSTFDFIVVGAGASGAVIASRLSENPETRVLLLEAGGAPPPATVIPAACAGLQQTEVDWQFRDSSPGDNIALGLVDKQMRLPRGKMLGGSTSINYMCYIRGHPADYDSWAAGGAKGWGFEDVLPYFKKSEGFAPEPGVKVSADQHGTEGPYSVTHRKPPFETSESFLKSCEQLGYTIGDQNGAERVSAPKGVVGHHQFSIKNGQRCSTYNAFLEPHMTRKNLTVVTGARTSHVILSDGTAVGVEYVTAAGTQRADARKEIVLSCGTYQSPHVLLRSGIGPKAELEAKGVECIVDSPHVGKHLRDHLYLPIPFAMDAAAPLGALAGSLGLTPDKTLFDEYMSTGQGLCATSLYDASLFLNTGVSAKNAHTHDAQISFINSCYNDTFFVTCNGIEDMEKHFDIETMFNMEKGSAILLPQMLQPQSEGDVTLGEMDVSSPPIIKHNYLTAEADLKCFISACKTSVKIREEMAKSQHVGDILIPKNIIEKHGTDLSSDALWEAWIRHYAITVYHPTSTCRIGYVVDERCRVKGVKGLRVADASVMPEIPSGNTQAACVMIGEKAAAMIAEDAAAVATK